MHGSRWAFVAITAAFFIGLGGCGGPTLAPVKGKVTYKGKPLQFGGIMFQPASGQPARGIIGADGTFTLSTYFDGDGAVVGKHHVRVTCFEGQRPAAGPSNVEHSLGKSLIPEQYSNYASSELTYEVQADKLNEPVFELVDSKK